MASKRQAAALEARRGWKSATILRSRKRFAFLCSTEVMQDLAAEGNPWLISGKQ